MKWIVLSFLSLLTLAVSAEAQLPPDLTASPCADSVGYTEIAMPTCDMTLLIDGPVVIETERELRDRVARHESICDTALIPPIDFSRHTLIGRWIHLGNCAAGQHFAVRVCRDEGARVYRHIVAVEENPCRGLSSYMSWILVPKLPPGYTVVFGEEGR